MTGINAYVIKNSGSAAGLLAQKNLVKKSCGPRHHIIRISPSGFSRSIAQSFGSTQMLSGLAQMLTPSPNPNLFCACGEICEEK